MKPVDNIEKLIRDSHVLDVNTSAEMDQKIMHDALKVQEKLKETNLASTQPNIWRIILNSRISKLAAAAVIIVAVGFFAVHPGPDEQIDKRGVSQVARSPVEMLTALSLNIAFRDGGMQAMEKQFDKAEKKVKAGLKTHLTVEQLICELDGC